MATTRQKGRASACQAGQTALAARLLERISADSLASGENFSSCRRSPSTSRSRSCRPPPRGTRSKRSCASPAELAVFVRDAVVDRVLADRSGVGGPSLAFACGAWTDLRWPLRSAYVDAVAGTFKGNTWAVDFCHKAREAREQINSWVAEVTRNLITEVIDPNSRSPTLHVVANAIYFKGEWCCPFKKENTIDEEFHCLGHRSPVVVPFLRSWSDRWIACHDGFKVLKLPYRVTNGASWELYCSQPKFAICASSSPTTVTACEASWRRSPPCPGSCTTTSRRNRSRSACSGCPSSS